MTPKPVTPSFDKTVGYEKSFGSISQVGTSIKHEAFKWDDFRVYGFYAAVFLLEGSGSYTDTNGRSIPVSAGDLILIFPDLGHQYGPGVGEEWRENYVVFDGPVFRLWDESGLINREQPVLRLSPIDHWQRRLEHVAGGTFRAGISTDLRSVCRLQGFLADAIASVDQSGSSDADKQWASRACALLERDPLKPIELDAIARKMRTSPASFRRRFVAIVGMPPGRYRTTRLVQRAADLMQTTDMRDAEIADELGFCDPQHFSRRFKQIMHKSPRAYRAGLP